MRSDKNQGSEETNRPARLWGPRVLKTSVLVMGILLILCLRVVISYARMIRCFINLYGLQPAIAVYQNDFDGDLPSPDAWNDLLIEHTDVLPSVFHCPGSNSAGELSDYAINENLYRGKSGKP